MLKKSNRKRVGRLQLGESKGAKRLKKRLGRKFTFERPAGGLTNRSFKEHTIPFGLTQERLKDKKVLFLGTGNSHIIYTARAKGIDAYGIEPHLNKIYFLTPDIKKFITEKSIQEYSDKKKFDYVIAVFSVPFSLTQAYDIRLSFLRMLSTLKVGGKLQVAPLKFGKFLRVGSNISFETIATSLEKKILKAGFKIEHLPVKEIKKRCKNAGIIPPFLSGITIERAPESNLRKLQELLSL